MKISQISAKKWIEKNKKTNVNIKAYLEGKCNLFDILIK